MVTVPRPPSPAKETPWHFLMLPKSILMRVHFNLFLMPVVWRLWRVNTSCGLKYFKSIILIQYRSNIKRVCWVLYSVIVEIYFLFINNFWLKIKYGAIMKDFFTTFENKIWQTVVRFLLGIPSMKTNSVWWNVIHPEGCVTVDVWVIKLSCGRRMYSKINVSRRCTPEYLLTHAFNERRVLWPNYDIMSQY